MGVLTTVTVDKEVLTLVVVTEVVGVVVATVTFVAELAVDCVVFVVSELEAEVELVACCPTTGGVSGSRWNMPASGFVTPVGPAPTAHPSCELPDWP